MIKHVCDSCDSDLSKDYEFKSFTYNPRRVWIEGTEVTLNIPKDWELCIKCTMAQLVQLQDNLTVVIKEIEDAVDKPKGS